jgi:exosortase/archaeosortase
VESASDSARLWGCRRDLVWRLFCLIWTCHVAIYPEHEFRDYWNKGLTFAAFFPSLLMAFAIVPGSVGAGLVSANLMVWLIPPARRAFDAKEATQTLGKFTAWSLGIGIPVSLIAAACLSSLH